MSEHLCPSFFFFFRFPFIVCSLKKPRSPPINFKRKLVESFLLWSVSMESSKKVKIGRIIMREGNKSTTGNNVNDLHRSQAIDVPFRNKSVANTRFRRVRSRCFRFTIRPIQLYHVLNYDGFSSLSSGLWIFSDFSNGFHPPPRKTRSKRRKQNISFPRIYASVAKFAEPITYKL